MARDLDVIVYGATGYTGRLVAEYLLQEYGPSGETLRWAMAGRSIDKLAEVRDLISAPEETPLVIADASDPASLDAMTASTNVIVTTVGPYQLYGNELVASCVRNGTAYADLCGEPAWMRQKIDEHAAAAQASGARITFSCGFDSIPFDLGVLYLTPIGMQVRAMADNRDLARSSGIKTTRVMVALWCLMGCVTAVGGAMLGIKTVVVPEMGWNLLLPGFAAAVLGGLGNPIGAVVAAVGLGVVQELATPLVGFVYKTAFSFAVLIVVLIWRPEGLFGRPEQVR